MNHQPFRILYLDQDDSSIRRVEELLKLTSSNCFIEVVKSVTDFQYALPGRHFDLIIAEFELVREGDWQAAKLARSSAAGVPLILLADRPNAEVLTEASRQGVWDYVLRTHLPSLPFVVCRARETHAYAQEQRLQFQSDLLRLTGEAIIVRRWDGTIVFWNEAAEQMYGWNQAEACGWDIRLLLPSTRESGNWEEAANECARTGRWEGAVTRRTREGREVTVTSRWHPRWDAKGHLTEIVEIDRQEAAASPAGISEEMARTLHKLNNMLAAISNVGDLLKTHVDDGLDGELFQILRTSSQRAAELVKGLSRPQTANVSETDPLPDQPVANRMFPNQNLCGNGECVLVVDDENTVRELVRTFLEHNGYKVDVARDGEEALAIFREKYQQIDLVLCDLGLPRMQGRDVVRQMRMIKPRLKLIVSTGATDKVTDLEIEGETLLSKPYDIDTALRAVRAKLNEVSKYAAPLAEEPLSLALVR